MRRIIIIGAMAAAAALAIIDAQTGTHGGGPRKAFFVSTDQLDAWSILPNPPADHSPAANTELAEVHHLQDLRTPAQIAHARGDDVEEDMFIFRDVLGDKFTAQALPQTALLSSHLHNDESVIGGTAKKKFRRLRPFNLDPTVTPVCKTNSDMYDYGYPSGHALTGYLEALALVQMAPEKRDAILSRADDYALSRVVCGVHYSGDTGASKLAAYAMMGIMMNNAQFRKELEAARAETRRALGLPL
jgi:acid phosphatase (class A)